MSPGDKVFVKAISQPAVPVAGKIKGVPVFVKKTFFKSRKIGFTRLGKSGALWSSIGVFIAF